MLKLNKIHGSLSTITLDVQNISLKSGEIVGLIGANGSGKSSLIKALTKESQLEEFDVSWNGKPAYQDELSYIPDSLRIKKGKVEEINLLYNTLDFRWDSNYFKEQCELLNINQDDKLSNLSLGESQKLMIAIAKTTNGNLLVMDEPSDGLDPLALRHFINGLVASQEDSKLTLIATHQIKQYENVLDRVLFLERGKILLNYTTVEIIEKGVELLTQHKAKTVDIDNFEISKSLDNFIRAIERRNFYVG